MSALNDTPAFCMNIFQFICLRLSFVEDSFDVSVKSEQRLVEGINNKSPQTGKLLASVSLGKELKIL